MCSCYMIWRSLVTIIFYLLDITSDIANGAFFIQRGHLVWGAATIVLMFLPAILNWIVVSAAYSNCFRGSYENYEEMLLSVPWIRRGSNWKRRLGHYILILFRLEPIYSHVKLMLHGAHGSHQRFDYEMKTMAEMFLEVCLQSIPQIVLQVYIMGSSSTVSGMQITATLLSLAKTWYILTSINFKQGKEKCQTAWWWWFVKIFWVLLGGAPFLLSAFPSVSLFASVYGSYFLGFHLIGIFLFFMKWWWWRLPANGKYDDFKCRTIYAFVVGILKTIFTMLIVMWFIRVKRFQDPKDTFTSPYITRVIPPAIWPSPSFCLENWSKLSRDRLGRPKWSQCDRKSMFRNGTFVTNLNKWSEGHSTGSNALEFLVQEKLFCFSDIADILFVIIFYSLLISFIWDFIHYIIRIFVTPDDWSPNDYKIGSEEERIKIGSDDMNDRYNNAPPVSHL